MILLFNHFVKISIINKKLSNFCTIITPLKNCLYRAGSSVGHFDVHQYVVAVLGNSNETGKGRIDFRFFTDEDYVENAL